MFPKLSWNRSINANYIACCLGNIVFNTVNTGMLMLCFSEGWLPSVSNPFKPVVAKEWKSKRSVLSHPVEPVMAKKGGGVRIVSRSLLSLLWLRERR